MKLGKLDPLIDERTLKFANYVDPNVLPTIPDECIWSNYVTPPWGWFLNNRVGDCTIASAAHMIMNWTACKGSQFTPTDNDVLSAYEAISGYNPQTGYNDNGAIELNVLKYWQKTGIAGHKIGAYISLNKNDIAHVKAAIYLFGGVYLGFALPLSVRGLAEWRIVDTDFHGNSRPGTWGGHAVPAMDYDENGLTIITWGNPMKVPWDFFGAYCDEGYVATSEDFINGSGEAINGFSRDALLNDLKMVA